MLFHISICPSPPNFQPQTSRKSGPYQCLRFLSSHYISKPCFTCPPSETIFLKVNNDLKFLRAMHFFSWTSNTLKSFQCIKSLNTSLVLIFHIPFAIIILISVSSIPLTNSCSFTVSLIFPRILSLIFFFYLYNFHSNLVSFF